MAKANRISVPLSMGSGEFSAGDAGNIPAGYVRSLQNYLPRPNRMPSRPPFVYDAQMSVNGLANFDDTTNKVSRLVAVNASDATFVKATTGETWGSSLGVVSGTRISDFVNYRGVLYAMLDDGTGLPSAAFSFDGTTLKTSPFNSPIAARCVTTLGERLFLAYPRVTVVNKIPAANAAYDPTTWAASDRANVIAGNITVAGQTIGRITPTSTTASVWGYDVASVLSTSAPTTMLWRCALRNTHASYDMPITLSILPRALWLALSSYPIGSVICPNTRNGFRYRATVGGSSGAGEPAWPVTVGATITDGGVTWICDGVDAIGNVEATVPNATVAPNFQYFTVPATFPPVGNGSAGGVELRIKFGNTTFPIITLAALDMAFRDGLADGNPSKQNYGQQLTLGDFYYPFFNTESTSTATIDMPAIVWSEIADPKRIRALNTYDLVGAIGQPTAQITVNGRLLAFKRNAMWAFSLTADPDIPIQLDRLDADVGCLGPRALDAYEGVVYLVGENDIYSTSYATPQPLIGDGMREAIMSKGANWVEAQSTYKRPLLAIDKKQLVIWVYTQKAKLYAYDLRTKVWSEHTTPNGAEVDAMLWNSNTGNFYVAFGGYGLTRMDYVTPGKDTIDNTATTYPVSPTIVFAPIELSSPERFDALLESVHIYHAATTSQIGQTLTAAYSFDQGATYPRSVTVTPSPLSGSGEMVPLRLQAFQTGPSVTVKLTVTGKTGESVWSISPRAYAKLQVKRGEYPQSNPTPVSESL